MLGSNIATTVTSFIIGLNLEKLSAYIMLIGFILITSKTKLSKAGKIIFNIGLLFFSIFIMSLATDNFKDSKILYSYIQNVSASFVLRTTIFKGINRKIRRKYTKGSIITKVAQKITGKIYNL
jgi:phosphate:Na+ symporter